MQISQIIDFTSELVRTASYENEKEVARLVCEKLGSLGQRPEIISSDLEHPSVICYISKPKAKKIIWLQAPLDTVSPGDLLSWKINPLIPTINDNKMYGLGVSDAKIGIALNAYLAVDLYHDPDFEGSIFLGFNADGQEQSSKATGIKDILSYVPECDACILGYQDYDQIHIGARGWLRLKVVTHGQTAHTGSRYNQGNNAIHSMNLVTQALLNLDLSDSAVPYFEFGSVLNISMIQAGHTINVVPDRCEAWIDVRLTLKQNPEATLELIGRTLKSLTTVNPKVKVTFEILQLEAPYLTNPDDPLVQMLKTNASKITGHELTLTASGPGSIGNIISQELNIPIINAFGVRSDDAHSPTEWIDLNTIEPTYKALRQTLIEYARS